LSETECNNLTFGQPDYFNYPKYVNLSASACIGLNHPLTLTIQSSSFNTACQPKRR